jgi:S-DNA-T family DNA segregation ATPase FtsK/SpoIIIE
MESRLKRIKEEIVGVFFTLFSVYVAITLVSYYKWDPSFFTESPGPVRNYGGIVGSYLSDTLISIFGYMAYLVPLFLGVFGIKRLLGKQKRREFLIGVLLLMLSVPMLLSLISYTLNWRGTSVPPGGLIGEVSSKTLIQFLSIPGAYIFVLSIFFSSIVIISPLSARKFLARVSEIRRREGASRPTLSTETEKEEPKIKYLRETQRTERESTTETLQQSGPYRLPSIELLHTYQKVPGPSKEELLERAELLEEKLADFNVTGKVTQVHPGPVVTMYEFEPSPGIKISKVTSLAHDLGRALGGLSVRIATIPGKTQIGIEVPNRQRGIVYLKEIIGSEVFRKSTSLLTLALGKDIYGRAVVADLSRMPHLLVAGTTGSGKSVLINSLVMSILYKASPEQVKMLMIDPKLLELSRYDGIAHLITPVITNPKDATVALKKMVLEMERRYRLIAEKGARNIDNYNRQVPDEERIPYMVVIIDELADLMFTASKEVENSIVRLAQMARASGIHLIVATQRPSVDVITGIIKANFPTRIAFQVTSKVDSRTIIDVQGAEQLIGMGDMLLMMPGARLRRLHGAYVSEDEVRAVVEFIKAQAEPDYTLFESIESEVEVDADLDREERDELYHKVIEYAESVGEISISSIQRRFKIGYNRAARIMQMLEEDGLVGPPKGAGKPRDFIGRA